MGFEDESDGDELVGASVVTLEVVTLVDTSVVSLVAGDSRVVGGVVGEVVGGVVGGGSFSSARI